MASAKEDYLNESVRDVTIAMREVSRAVDAQNLQWPQLIDSLNSEFVLHNSKTEELAKSIDAHMIENATFRTEIWSKMWGLTEKVVIIFAVMAGGSIVARFMLGV